MEYLEKRCRKYAALMGGDAEESQAALRMRSPHMFDAMVEGAFGGILAYAELGRKHA